MTNFGLAPRAAGCWVCRNVASPEDVTLRLIDAASVELPYADAIEYLTGIGHSTTRKNWRLRLKRHRAHVVRWVERPVVTPAAIETGQVVRLDGPGGAPSWVRAPDRAIDLGMEAIDALSERLENMEDADLIAVARLGLSASGKRGDWEAKGRQMGQMDALLKLASGHGG